VATVEQNTEANSPQFSPGLEDIVKLTKSGVEESVILSFIKSSEVAYQPSAQEVVRLRGLGVSATAVATLLQRGDELRQRAAEAQKHQAQPAPAPATTEPAPHVASPPEPTRVYNATPAAYSVESPNVVYVPSYSYSSWPYYGYGGYYGGCYPSFSIGFGYGGGCYYPRGYYYGGCYGGYRGSYHVGSYGAYHGGSHGGYHR
jgi:hypothetical protein